MDWLGLSELVGCVVLAGFVAFVVWLIVRRRVLGRSGGLFECFWKVASAPSSSWSLGFARYDKDMLQWFRGVSFALRPHTQLNRTRTSVVAQRAPALAEAGTLVGGDRIVTLACDDHACDMAMPEDALTGLLAWLDAAPPGSNLPPRID